MRGLREAKLHLTRWSVIIVVVVEEKTKVPHRRWHCQFWTVSPPLTSSSKKKIILSLRICIQQIIMDQ
ncbi:hypothetical protein BT93_G0524 [Corymbia citriodora subsp. variegata]|nr:hypothetical protein BT93_G0524 [Corymbia citriodora subsp. variegata]